MGDVWCPYCGRRFGSDGGTAGHMNVAHRVVVGPGERAYQKGAVFRMRASGMEEDEIDDRLSEYQRAIAEIPKEHDVPRAAPAPPWYDGLVASRDLFSYGKDGWTKLALGKPGQILLCDPWRWVDPPVVPEKDLEDALILCMRNAALMKADGVKHGGVEEIISLVIAALKLEPSRSTEAAAELALIPALCAAAGVPETGQVLIRAEDRGWWHATLGAPDWPDLVEGWFKKVDGEIVWERGEEHPEDR